jgi:hypothetical protein
MSELSSRARGVLGEIDVCRGGFLTPGHVPDLGSLDRSKLYPRAVSEGKSDALHIRDDKKSYITIRKFTPSKYLKSLEFL